MDDWAAELQRGRSEAAWDLFVDRYRRLVIAAIRHYAQDYDDVMDVFARVCEALREDDFRRLRQYAAEPVHQARFSTWLVTVVRHLTVDWFRHRDGRRRVAAIAETLPPLRRRIFEYVFIHGRTHIETYELMGGAEGLDLSFGEFLLEVAATYRVVAGDRRGHLFQELGGTQPPESIAVIDRLSAPDPPPTSDAGEAIAAVMETLAPDDRVAVELYVIDGLPAQDVARILGLPNSKAVYNRVYRALSALRERLERAGIRREDL
jgi:DNA-directed RNA polymerase specialized sigma24 family protein